MGAARLRDRVREECGPAVIPIGPTHRDFHFANVLTRTTGDPVLVDWDGFETPNPLLLDAVAATVSLHQLKCSRSFIDAMTDFIDENIDGPIAERARLLMGPLTALQALTIGVLDTYALKLDPLHDPSRRLTKPWSIEALRDANAFLTDRLADW